MIFRIVCGDQIGQIIFELLDMAVLQVKDITVAIFTRFQGNSLTMWNIMAYQDVFR